MFGTDDRHRRRGRARSRAPARGSRSSATAVRMRSWWPCPNRSTSPSAASAAVEHPPRRGLRPRSSVSPPGHRAVPHRPVRSTRPRARISAVVRPSSVAVVPLAQIGIDLGVGEPGEAAVVRARVAGLTSTSANSCAASTRRERSCRGPTGRGERHVGAARVPTGLAPLGLPVADEPDVRFHRVGALRS